MASGPAHHTIFLAVLPFEIMNGNPQVDMFCQGLVMDLINDLSRFRPFQIIAHNTAKLLDPDERADSLKLDELQLDYLVKGLVRHRDEKLLFNLQLINVPQNRLVWAEKFNGGFDELFSIQEEIVEKIVVSLQHFVDYDLISDVRKKPLTSLNVYECWLKGYQELKKGTLEADERARSFFQQAIKMDPHFARAFTGMSLSYFNEWSCQLWSRWEVSSNGAFEWAQKALELDELDHVSNAILGRIYLFRGDYEKSEHYLRKSLEINPNDAEMLILLASSFVFLGYPEDAHELYHRARRLNPADNLSTNFCGAFIHFELGNIEESIELAEKHEIGKGWVDFPAFLAAGYFLKGDLDKMKESWNIFLSEFSQKINGGKPADTQTALKWMINVNPYRVETRLKPFWEYMSDSDPDELVVEKAEHVSRFRNSFFREGELWSLNFAGKQSKVPDLKGCHDLAKLLARPGKPVHCTELMGAETLEKGQPVIDEKAKLEYQNRILSLQQQMEEADAAMDAHRLGVLQEEYDQLIEHLSRAVGKGGKSRKVSGTVEKCRTAVTWRIRSAIRKIGEVHPSLGKHLEKSVKTGIFCEYAPEHETRWIL